MSAKIDDILAAARRHCDEVIRPGRIARQKQRKASNRRAVLPIDLLERVHVPADDTGWVAFCY